MLKFSIRENMLPAQSLAEKFRDAKQMGLNGIEITDSSWPEYLDDIRKVSQATGICPNIISHRAGGCFLDADRAERERAVNGLKQSLQMCGELGGVGVIIVPLLPVRMQGRPRIPDLSPWKTTPEIEQELFVEILRGVAPFAANVGANVIIEPLNRYEQFWPNRVEQGVQICEAVGSPNVGTMADFFHMNIEDADFAAAIRTGGKWLRNIHLADSQRLLPGYGHTEFGPGLKAIQDIGYDYYCGFECGLLGDPFVEVPKSIEYIRNQLPA